MFGILRLLAIALFLVACQPFGGNDHPSATTTPITALRLQAFGNCDQYRANLEASLVSMYTDYQDYGFGGAEIGRGPQDGVVVAEDTADGANGGTQAAPDGVSQTNIQEAGVDEADLVKTDSNGTLYLVEGQYFIIARGFPPADLQELSRLDLGASAASLYFDEVSKRVIVLSGYDVMVQSDVVAPAAIYPGSDYQSVLTFIDVSDITQPAIQRRIRLDGNYVSSRRLGNRIHRVGHFPTPLPKTISENREFWDLLAEYQQAYWSGTKDEETQNTLADLKQDIENYIHTAVAGLDLAALLPVMETETGDNSEQGAMLSCENISHPEVTTRTGLMMVSSFDLDGGNFQTTAITGDAWQTYASKDNLYLVQNSGGWWWRSNPQQQTVVHKFSISDTAPVYLATGTVPGWVNDQFSLSEHKGYLRIATTYGRAGNNVSWITTNELFVLEDDGQGGLDVAGEVRGYGKDERIFSARFLGDKGFVVTFRQIDPLFTFDLSDPYAPRLMGEVEIPGFSSYIHALDETHLLTIGSGGDELGASNRLQLQIFDVSDLANPVRIHQVIPESSSSGYSWSVAMHEHLAFTYYEQRNILVFPLSVYDYNSNDYFNGFAAFKVDVDAGFSELGRIDHKDLAYEHLCVQGGADSGSYQYQCDQNGYIYWVDPRRSVIINSGDDDWIYTISNIGVKASNAMTPNTAVGSMVF